MNNEQAKQILSAYRPGGEDASDPIFQQALEQARRDPELALWFKRERERDTELARLLQSLPLPQEHRRSLLGLPRAVPSRKRLLFWRWSAAFAACAAILLGVAFSLKSRLEPTPDLMPVAGQSLGASELLHLAHHAKPLDFRSDSVRELRAWLTDRGAPAPDALANDLAALPAIGCRVFMDDQGNAITLLCLMKDGELVHLFVAEGTTREALAVVENRWIQHDEWSAYCWGDGEQSYVLLSRAPAQELQGLVI